MSPESKRFLFAMHEFAIGGVGTLFASVARQASRDGHECTVVASGASATAGVDWGGAECREVDCWNAAAVEVVVDLVADADLVLCAVTPPTALLAPLLTRAPRVVLSFHGSDVVMSAWIERQARHLLAELVDANRHIGLLAPGASYVEGLAAHFGGSPSRWGWFPHVTDQARRPVVRSQDAPSSARVLCPARLSPEKEPMFRAAAALAIARGAELVAVGDGDADWLRSLLGQFRGLTYTVVEDSKLAPWLRREDIVVAGGIIALEALAAGCAVVAVSRADGGSVLDVVTPENWERLHRTNFLGLEGVSIPADEAWRRLDKITHRDRAAVAVLVERDAHPASALTAILESGLQAPAWAGHEDAVTSALVKGWMESEVRSDRHFRGWSDVHDWAFQLTEARDYFRARSERFEHMLKERSFPETPEAPAQSQEGA